MARTPTMPVGIIGAGPVGLYAAFRLVQAGHRVVVWERDTVGASVGAWGHVRLFSELGLNLRADARAALEVGFGGAAPPRALAGDDAFLTGGELSRDVLGPLAAWLRATGRCAIAEGARVVSVGRGRLLKKTMRREGPFRVLVRSPDGSERCDYAEAVVDCSGTYGPLACLKV